MCSKRKYNVLIIETKIENFEKSYDWESGFLLARFYIVDTFTVGDVKR